MKRFAKKLTALLMAAMLLCVLPLSALAAVPARPGTDGTILDEAGVLSSAVEEQLTKKNETLFAATGAEIAVVCVDFLDGEDIDDFAYDVFNTWGVGSSERNNGLLLVLAIAEENYYAMPGYGIEDTFDGGALQEMLDAYLEDDFAAGNYESGVEKFFDAAYEILANYSYNDSYTETEIGGVTDPGYVEETVVYETELTGVLSFMVKLILLIVVIILVVAVVRAASRLNRQPPPPAGGAVPPPPQRNNFWTGMFVGSMLNRRRPPRRNSWGAPPPPHQPPHHQPPHHNPGPRPGGFGSSGRPGGFGGGSRPSRPSGGFSHGGSSRPSGGRPSGGGFSRGGGSRGGGAGRK